MRYLSYFSVFALLCAPQLATPSDSEPGGPGTAVQDAQTATGGSGSSGLVDERGAFQALVHLGLVIDSFTAQELRKYLNPADSGTVRSDRSAFGAVFNYRLFGDPNLQKPGNSKRTRRLSNLWVYGHTLHGVRSSDVDCAATPELPSCKASLGEIADPANLPKASLYILRNATSLEGHVGLRWEFLGLQQQSESPANLYVNTKLGFLNVAGSGGDLQDLHHVGIGAVATKGGYMNSHLEIGYGRSDLFVLNPRRRFKLDGHLQKSLPFGNGAVALFIRMFVDSDFGRGADSVQSYAGILFDLGKLAGPGK